MHTYVYTYIMQIIRECSFDQLQVFSTMRHLDWIVYLTEAPGGQRIKLLKCQRYVYTYYICMCVCVFVCMRIYMCVCVCVCVYAKGLFLRVHISLVEPRLPVTKEQMKYIIIIYMYVYDQESGIHTYKHTHTTGQAVRVSRQTTI